MPAGIPLKKRMVIFAVLLFTSGLVACNPKTIPQTDVFLTFFDDAGREITLTEKPKKVAVLFSSYAEIWTSVGGQITVTVGESVERGFAKKGTVLVNDGAGKTIDREALLAATPDFIIGSTDIPAQVNSAEFFLNHGIPFALFHVEDFSDYKRVMRIVCDINENETAYQTLVEDTEKQILTVLNSVPNTPPKRILFVRCASSAKATKAKTAEENFVCRMLKELHTENVAERAKILLDGLSVEAVLQEDPEMIFFSTMGDEASARNYVTALLQESAWQHLSAVKNGNYYFLPKDLFQFKPNHHWANAYEYLFRILYGEETA